MDDARRLLWGHWHAGLWRLLHARGGEKAEAMMWLLGAASSAAKRVNVAEPVVLVIVIVKVSKYSKY